MHVLEVYQDLLFLAFLVSWSLAVEKEREGGRRREGEEGREKKGGRRSEWGQGREGRKRIKLPIFILMPTV